MLYLTEFCSCIARFAGHSISTTPALRRGGGCPVKGTRSVPRCRQPLPRS